MKYKKYLLFLLVIMVIGVNRTYAKETKTCYYTDNVASKEESNANAVLTVKWSFPSPNWHNEKGYLWVEGFSEITVNKAGKGTVSNKEGIINWYSDYKDNKTGITLKRMYKDSLTANKGADCPEYLIVRTKDNYRTYGVYSTNNLTEAKNFVDASEQTGKYHAWYLQHKNADGSEITGAQYYEKLTGVAPGEGFDISGDTATVDCTIFGDKDDPNSIRYLVNEILQYPRIIVPVLVIGFGVLDLSKAVIAGKEDEMKKAQKTFIKRIVIGVVFFFIPVFIDIIMHLADIVWQGKYISCDL